MLPRLVLLSPHLPVGGASVIEARISLTGHDFCHFLKVHIRHGDVYVAVKLVPSPSYEQLGRFGYMAWLHMSSLFRFHGVQILLLLIAGGLAMAIYGKIKGGCGSGTRP
jgi:hypothetical protein